MPETLLVRDGFPGGTVSFPWRSDSSFPWRCDSAGGQGFLAGSIVQITSGPEPEPSRRQALLPSH